MKRFYFVVIAGLICWLAPSEADAQPTYLACSTGCPPRYYWETAPLTRTAPSAVPVDGTVGSGMKLTYVTGAWISVCAASGQTLSGAGTLDAYFFDPAAGLWMRNDDLDLSVTVTAATYRCQVWPDFAVSASKAGYVLYATNGITVSGGTTVVVRVSGSL